MMSSLVSGNQFKSPVFEQLGEKYLIKREVGRSQAASLYQAVERASGRAVALKIFRRKFSADPRFAINFRDHMREIFRINNEYLVPIWDYGMADGHYYIASEWINGQDLGAYLARAGRLGELQAIAIASQICRALETVHNHGLLHQNLKPENILLTSQGQVKLTDIGLSGLISESGLTRTHVLVGRYHYVAPEQVNGLEPAPASDLYSLGVILYEMLTGQYPFDSRDVWEVMRMHVEKSPPPIEQNDHKISEALVKIVQQTLHKSPRLRFQSAADLNTALTAVLMDSVPTERDFGPTAHAGFEGQLRHFVRGGSDFLSKPAPFRLMGMSFAFGWLLLVQFVVSFSIALLLLNVAFTVVTRFREDRIQIQESAGSVSGAHLLQKSIHKTSLAKQSQSSQGNMVAFENSSPLTLSESSGFITGMVGGSPQTDARAFWIA